MGERNGRQFENNFFGCHDRPVNGSKITYSQYVGFAPGLLQIVTNQSNPQVISRSGWNPHAPVKGCGAVLFSLVAGQLQVNRSCLGMFNVLDSPLDAFHGVDGFILISRIPLVYFGVKKLSRC